MPSTHDNCGIRLPVCLPRCSPSLLPPATSDSQVLPLSVSLSDGKGNRGAMAVEAEAPRGLATNLVLLLKVYIGFGLSLRQRLTLPRLSQTPDSLAFTSEPKDHRHEPLVCVQ